MGKKKVLLVGWDAADWKIISPLVDAGQMPALESLINNGVMGNLATLDPPFSPILWTSIATGMYADKHGVLGFVEPMSNQVGVRPVSAASRKVKAIWNILTQNNYKTHVVGWWPSHPAESINGVMVSNLAQKVSYNPAKEEFPPGAVHPKELTPLIKHLRIHPAELTHEHLIPFVPKMSEVDQTVDHRLSSVAKILSENATIQAYITWAMENNDWDFAAVYFDGVDHFSHLAMQYHPPKLPWISEKDYNLYKDVVNSAYRFFDMTLQKLLSLTDENTTVILVSDHGFVSDHNRQSHAPMEPAGPANDHREHGIFLASGPGIKKDERLYGASLLDITPSILHIFGLPVGEDMDGRVLTEIFDTSKPVETIESWDKVDGFCGSLPLDAEEDPLLAQEALQQLVELGYIEKPEEDSEKAVKSAAKELQYNLSRVLTGAGKVFKALPVLKKLYNDYPDETRFAIRYARCLFDCTSYQESLDLLEIIELKLKNARLSKENVDAMYLLLNQKRNDEDGDTHEPRQKTIRKLKAHHQNISDLLQVLLLKAENSLKIGDDEIGFKQMDAILADFGRKTNVLFTYATMLIRRKKWDDAAKLYKELMKSNSESYPALHGFGLCLLRLNKPQDALDYLLQAISLQFYNPRAHFHVGQALYALEEYSEAATALEVCLKLVPSFSNARNLLINIIINNLDNSDRADSLKDFYSSKEIVENTSSEENMPLIASRRTNLKQFAKSDIIVVSGLPRSGTSLMMQILKSSGLEILTDEERVADESNPKGYFEFEKVKHLAQDKSWLPQAQGKVLKVVSHLLRFLPPRYNYKVVFMLRNITEIVSSQEEMMIRNGKSSGKTFRADLLHNYSEHLKKTTSYLKSMHNMQVIFIDYNKLLAGSESEIEFLQSAFPEFIKKDIVKTVIDPNLYRVKIL